MTDASTTFRFSTKHLIAYVAVVVIICAIPSCVRRMAISTQTLDQLYAREDTLTRDDVLRIAGNPQNRYGDDHFCYNVWNGPVFFSDMFCIDFDEDGKVVWMSF